MPRGGNLANCRAATITWDPILWCIHGRRTPALARDHTPRVQPPRVVHTTVDEQLPVSVLHSLGATGNTYYLPVLRAAPWVLPRDRNKPALFVRVIENSRQTRTASLAARCAPHHRGDCDRPIGNLRSASPTRCDDGVGFEMKIRLSSAGEDVLVGIFLFFSFFLFGEER